MNCKFKCMRCGCYFEKERPGPVECSKCGDLWQRYMLCCKCVDEIIAEWQKRYYKHLRRIG